MFSLEGDWVGHGVVETGPGRYIPFHLGVDRGRNIPHLHVDAVEMKGQARKRHGEGGPCQGLMVTMVLGCGCHF